MKSKNLLITGIPRSGTSLITGTIHDIPNCVALSEPVQLRRLKKSCSTAQDYAGKLLSLTQTLRGQIEQGIPLPNKLDRENKQVSTNYYKRVKHGESYRMEKSYKVGEEVFSIQNSHFTLCLKNNAQFTACLDALANLSEFRIVATIRNPLACILSWRSLNISISSGRQPGAERFSRELKAIARIKEVMMRQVQIMDWYCKAYYRNARRITLIRYENFVEKPDLLRELIEVPQDYVFPGFKSMNNRPEYNFEEADGLRACLKAHTQYVKMFYPEL